MLQDLTFEYEINQDGCVTILGVDASEIGAADSLVVPASIMVNRKELPVTEVAFQDKARNAMRNIRKVTLPEGLLAIGHRCFYGLGVEYVAFPATLKSIGDAAFKGCRNLREAILPEGLEYVGLYAFSEVGKPRRRTHVSIPASASIGSKAFSKSYLGRAVINCSTIGDSAFVETKFAKLTLGPGVRKIMDSAFDSSNALHLLGRIPDNVVYIGNNAFIRAVCDANGSDTIALPDGITIGTGVFAGCNMLRAIDVGEAVWSVLMQTDSTFAESGIEHVVIPDGVVSIGSGVCRQCKALKSVDIPASVTTIGERAFWGSGLKRLVLPDTITEIGVYAFAGLAYCTDISVSPPIWKSLLSSHSLKGIGLERIDVPEGVESLDFDSLTGCRDLRSVSLPQSLQTIDEYVFAGCHLLQSIDIPPGVATLDSRVFEKCYSLRSVTLHDGLKEIRDLAFGECRSLLEVDIPASVKSVYNDAFKDCYSLKRLILRHDPDLYAYPLNVRESVDWYVPDEYLEEAKLLKVYTNRRVLPLSQLEPLPLVADETCPPQGKRLVHLKIDFLRGLFVLSHKVEPEHLPLMSDRENAGPLIYRYLLADMPNCEITYLAPTFESYSVIVFNDKYEREFDGFDVKFYRTAAAENPFAGCAPSLSQPFERDFFALCDFYIDEDEKFDIKQLSFESVKLGGLEFFMPKRFCYKGEWYECEIFLDEEDNGKCKPATINNFARKYSPKAETVHFYSHDGIVEKIIPKSFALESILIKN